MDTAAIVLRVFLTTTGTDGVYPVRCPISGDDIDYDEVQWTLTSDTKEEIATAQNSAMDEIANSVCGFYSTNQRLSQSDVNFLVQLETRLRQ